MSLSLQLIPFAIEAFKPIVINTQKNNEIGTANKYFTKMNDLSIIKQSFDNLSVIYEENIDGIMFIMNGFRGSTNISETNNVYFLFDHISNMHCRDIIQIIYEEYISIINNILNSRIPEVLQLNDYKLINKHIDIENKAISFIISA